MILARRAAVRRGLERRDFLRRLDYSAVEKWARDAWQADRYSPGPSEATAALDALALALARRRTRSPFAPTRAEFRRLIDAAYSAAK